MLFVARGRIIAEFRVLEDRPPVALRSYFFQEETAFNVKSALCFSQPQRWAPHGLKAAGPAPPRLLSSLLACRLVGRLAPDSVETYLLDYRFPL